MAAGAKTQKKKIRSILRNRDLDKREVIINQTVKRLKSNVIFIPQILLKPKKKKTLISYKTTTNKSVAVLTPKMISNKLPTIYGDTSNLP